MRVKRIVERFSQAHWVFAFVALIFGTTFVFIVPPLWGLDETSHFARTYQIAQGEIIPHTDSATDYGGFLPENLVALRNYVKDDLLNNIGQDITLRKDVDSVEKYRQLTNQSFSVNKAASPDTSAYSPVAYVGPTVGVLFASVFNLSIGQTITMARLFSLFFYVTIVFLSIKLLKNSKSKWILFTVALLPAALSQASVVSADSVQIALAILFIAIFIRLIKCKDNPNNSRKLFYTLSAIAILMPLVKINYIFLSLGIFLLPKDILKTVNLTKLGKSLTISIAVAAAFLWAFLARVTGNSPISQRPDGLQTSIGDQIMFSLENPLHFFAAIAKSIVHSVDSYITSATSQVGWNYVNIPIIFIVILCFGLLIAGIYARSEVISLRKKLAGLVIFVFLGIISIYGALYAAFNPVGSNYIEGVQGRYFLPFLIPILITLGVLLPLKIIIKDRVATYLFSTITILCLMASILYYYFSTY